MEWSRLGDTPNIMGKVRPFHNIEVWGHRLNNLKKD